MVAAVSGGAGVTPVRRETTRWRATVAETDGTEHFDASMLERSSGGDPEFRSLLVEVFVRQAEEQIAAIEAAVAACDFGAARQVAHKLRSSSASVGAMRVSRMAGDIEAMCVAGDTAGVPGLGAGLRAEYERVHPHIAEFLPR
jgi:HPt (histidine-containing phosphotransfer) domain-containing protein